MPSPAFSVSSTSITVAYSGMQSWSVRVSLEWRCKLFTVPNGPFSLKPFPGFRFMYYRHSSTRPVEDTKSDGSNIISFPFISSSVDLYLHMHRFRPCQLVIPLFLLHQSWCSKSGATARTKLAQADAPPAVLDASPCERRI